LRKEENGLGLIDWYIIKLALSSLNIIKASSIFDTGCETTRIYKIVLKGPVVKQPISKILGL
jgi:hypothetical protein